MLYTRLKLSKFSPTFFCTPMTWKRFFLEIYIFHIPYLKPVFWLVISSKKVLFGSSSAITYKYVFYYFYNILSSFTLLSERECVIPASVSHPEHEVRNRGLEIILSPSIFPLSSLSPPIFHFIQFNQGG